MVHHKIQGEKMSWFATGKDGMAKAEEYESNLSLIRNTKRSFWFRLKRGETCRITFLDNPEFFFKIHTVKVEDRYLPITCISDVETCPLCEAGNTPSYVRAGTIINHNEFRAKNGNVYKNQKQVIVFKSIAKKVIAKLAKNNNKTLQYAVVEVERTDAPKSLQSGDLFDFLKRLNAEKVKKFAPPDVDPDEWIKPFDYAEEFAPPSIEEMIKLAGGKVPSKPPIGAEDSMFDDDDDDEKASEEEAPSDDTIKTSKDLV